MARTVEDCAYLLQALAGYDATDPASSREPVPDYVAPLGRGVRGLRVGVPRDYFFEGIDPEVEKGFEQALATLRQLGATVEDVQIPSIQSVGAFMAIMLAEAFAYHERDLREHPELFGELLRERLLAGALITGSEYVQAQRIRTRLQSEMNTVLRRVDVLATGFRNANGLALLADGALTVPCSEGEWTPASMICLVKPREDAAASPVPHFGHLGPINSRPPTLPMVYLPRGLDNSSGGQAVVRDSRFGPLAGQIIHFSSGQGSHFPVLRDEVPDDQGHE